MALQVVPGQGFSTPMDRLVAEWNYSLRAEGLSPRTVSQYTGEAMKAFVRHFGEQVNPATVTRPELTAFILSLIDSRSRRTASNYGCAMRKFFVWAHTEGICLTNPAEGLRLPRPDVPEVVVIPDEAVTRMLATTRDGKGRFENVRDFALMRLLLSAGPRAAEVRGLRVTDVDLEEGTVAVVGKGRKPRRLPLSDKAIVAMARYLRARTKHPQAGNSDALWLTQWGAISKQGLEKMLQRRAREAGVAASLVTAHKWRHTVASAWLEAGGQEGDLMRVMGWSERKMLDRYGRFTQARRALEAHRKLKHDRW